VWRLEFELRRQFMRRLEAQEPEAVLDRVPALWRYCMESWLSLRTPSAHAVKARWPVHPAWVEASGLLGEVQEGRELVWQAAEGASELRAVRLWAGSLTTLAAMHGIDDLDVAAAIMAGRAKRYLAGLDRTFATEVARRRARLEVRGVRYDGLESGRNVRLGPGGPGWRVLGDDPQVGQRARGRGPKAQEEGRAVPRIGRSARTARRARVGQSTFLGRPPKDTTEVVSGKDRTISAVPVSGGESRRGWLEAQRNGEAVSRRGDGGERDAGGDETGPRVETEGEVRPPGEGGRAHHRGDEDDGGGRAGDAGRAMVPVGAEPPTQPEGHDPNRSRGGRVGARKRQPGWRGSVGRRGRSKPRRAHGRRLSVSSWTGGAGVS
jgi:hypothetical protein